MREVLGAIGVEVLCIVDDDEESFDYNGVLVRPVYELLEENVDEIFILIIGNKENEKGDVLKKLGFCFFENYNYIEDYQDVEPHFLLEPNLGLNYIFHTTLDEPGIIKWGDEKKADITIVASGNSTTTSILYNFKSWPQLLYEKLSLNGYKAAVIDAACSSYKSSQELMKLQRDVILYQPDIVLSYTGINDSFLHKTVQDYPFIYYFQYKVMEEGAKYIKKAESSKDYVLGVKNHLGKEWQFVQNIRMMRGICREFGVEFQAFLQPTLSAKMGKLTPMEYELIWQFDISHELLERTKIFFEQVKEIDNNGSLIDITHLFDECDNIYMDFDHVTEAGNEIIANYMYDFLNKKGWLLK